MRPYRSRQILKACPNSNPELQRRRRSRRRKRTEYSSSSTSSKILKVEKMSQEAKDRGVAGSDHHDHHHHEQQPEYGTFQGVANYPPQPVIGFPQPVPPPGATESSAPPSQYYAHGYQAVPVYAVAEGRPVRERRLPCCGLGIGWFLFIIGFFLAAIPWYVGAFILLCARVDYREKPGYITCTVAAVLATIAIIFGLTRHDW